MTHAHIPVRIVVLPHTAEGESLGQCHCGLVSFLQEWELTFQSEHLGKEPSFRLLWQPSQWREPKDDEREVLADQNTDVLAAEFERLRIWQSG